MNLWSYLETHKLREALLAWSIGYSVILAAGSIIFFIYEIPALEGLPLIAEIFVQAGGIGSIILMILSLLVWVDAMLGGEDEGSKADLLVVPDREDKRQ